METCPAGFSSLISRYRGLEGAASNASALSLSQPIAVIASRLPEAKKTSGLFRDLSSYLNELGCSRRQKMHGIRCNLNMIEVRN